MIGIVGSAFALLGIAIIEKLKIDDPVGKYMEILGKYLTES